MFHEINSSVPHVVFICKMVFLLRLESTCLIFHEDRLFRRSSTFIDWKCLEASLGFSWLASAGGGACWHLVGGAKGSNRWLLTK